MLLKRFGGVPLVVHALTDCPVWSTPPDPTTQAESTLFDRFARGRENTVVKMLTIQYRMNKKIMAWSSSAMYQNKLVADPAVRLPQQQWRDAMIDDEAEG